MGLLNEGDHDLGAAEAQQELLPLYSENDPATSAGELEPPGNDATPAQVRSYIASVLERRGVELEHAKTLSAKWLLGTGAELREYTRDMFVGIFGAEDGWVIHKDVQANLAPEVARNAAETAEKQRLARRAETYGGRWYFVGLFLIGLILLSSGIAMANTNLTWAKWIGIILCFPGGFSTLMGAVFLLFLALNHWGNFSF